MNHHHHVGEKSYTLQRYTIPGPQKKTAEWNAATFILLSYLWAEKHLENY